MRRALALPLALLLSCGSDPVASSGPTAVTKAIGPEGGEVIVGGATVTFPRGAVDTQRSVTITATDAAAPPGYVALSRVFKCEPSGLEFSQPVTMRMPFTDDGKPKTMFWSSGADPAFKDLGGTVEAGAMIATVKHFSSGFVGRKL